MSGIKTTNKILHNFSATVNPSATDDYNAGYVVGSRWVNIVSRQEFTCRGNTVADAVWVVTGNSWQIEYVDNADYTVTTQDAGKLFVVSTNTLASIITLPSIASAKDGFTVVIAKDELVNTVTINTSGGNNIRRSGANVTTIVMSGLGASTYLVKQANAWTIVDDNTLLVDHVSDMANPHVVTASQLGLGSVADHPIASQGEAESGVLNTRYMTPLRTKQAMYTVIPAGTIMLFHQAAAPVGWTQDTTASLNDRMIRLVNTAGGGVAGTSSPISNITTTDLHSLLENQMPKHYHKMKGPNAGSVPQGGIVGFSIYGGGTPDDGGWLYGTYSVGGNAASNSSGVGTSVGVGHSHLIPAWTPKYANIIICSKD